MAANKPLFGLSATAQKIVIVVCFTLAAVIFALTVVPMFWKSKTPPPGLGGTWVFDTAVWPKFKETVPPFGRDPVEAMSKANVSVTMGGGDSGDFVVKTAQGETKTTYEVTYKGSGVLSVKLAKADPVFGDRVSFQRPKGPDLNPDGMIIRWGMGMAMPVLKK